MLPERFFLGQPVRSLQQMLRQISYAYTSLPRVIPDGIFEEETERAVLLFQENFGLPATGTVDNDTWDIIVSVYRDVDAYTRRPRRPATFPSFSYQVEPEKSTVHMLIIQSMFKSLPNIFEEVLDLEIDGHHTGPSVENVRWLQRRSNLKETGAVDSLSWDMLTRLYEIFITRNRSID